ncbi:PadR family transcriptional regulator [Actinosynnema sp. ALI-1.44]|uniref:PadR family transcriptional regulator n=1 Tax=Actinosynnema sp. ALI-1.44 TaxID=1933779 RepID=UPI002E8E485E|nr:PadR family transcriptional regulator [Actinosynnema sp. ALI-1.44]
MSSRSMSEQAFLVLTALAERPLHGYAIVQAVEAMSEGRVRLRVGTLYGVLDRLVADGFAERDREEVHQGRLRRYYRLTDSGIQALAAEVNRLTANVRAASSVLRATGFAPPQLGGL